MEAQYDRRNHQAALQRHTRPILAEAKALQKGTPEERAAKTAPQMAPAASIVPLPGSRPPLSDDGPSVLEFLHALKARIVQEFAAGRNVDQIFSDLEDSARRWQAALGRFAERRGDCEA